MGVGFLLLEEIEIFKKEEENKQNYPPKVVKIALLDPFLHKHIAMYM